MFRSMAMKEEECSRARAGDFSINNKTQFDVSDNCDTPILCTVRVMILKYATNDACRSHAMIVST